MSHYVNGKPGKHDAIADELARHKNGRSFPDDYPGDHIHGPITNANAWTQDEIDRAAQFDASQDEHGDVWKPSPPLANGKSHRDDTAANEKQQHPRWRVPVPISQLPDHGPAVDWISKGLIAKGHLTLFSALFKVGKSTFLSHLLRCLQFGVPFIGRETRESRTLFVSEESAATWRTRRDGIGLDDHLHIMCRPMFAKPSFAEWREFIDYLAELAIGYFDMIVIDTLGTFAPWENENDAAQVTATLNPLFKLTEAGIAVVPVHHIGKVDGSEGRAARGSTAIGAAMDVLLELRRFKPDELDDRRRVLSGLGRFDEIPSEVVIELAEDGSGYTASGDKKAVAAREIHGAIQDVLPEGQPGMTTDDVLAALPKSDRRRTADVKKALREGVETGTWQRSGTGKKGNPFRFWSDSVPAVPKPRNGIAGGTGFIPFPPPVGGNGNGINAPTPQDQSLSSRSAGTGTESDPPGEALDQSPDDAEEFG